MVQLLLCNTTLTRLDLSGPKPLTREDAEGVDVLQDRESPGTSEMRLEGEEDGVPATALREIAILRELKHPNVIELQHVFHTDKSLYLAFEYCDDGDLADKIKELGPAGRSEAQQLIRAR